MAPFTPFDGKREGNKVGSDVFNAPLSINIVAKLLGNSNILRVELFSLNRCNDA